MPEIIAGKNPVLEALKAGRPLNKILLAKGGRSDAAINERIGLARHEGIPLEFLERPAFERAFRDQPAAGRISQGVVAYAAPKDYIYLYDLLAIPQKTGAPALFCVLDGIEDP